MQKSILKNLSYNVILQVVLLVLPLISVPFVARALGAEGVGSYSFTLANTQYFIILGTIGLSLYGNRQIAYTRDNHDKMSQTFWSILILRALTTGTALIIYLLLFSQIEKLQILQLIQSVHIIAAMIDVTWLFIGLEEFKQIVLRNLFIKIFGLIIIFAFIRKPEHLILYTLINVGMSFGSSVIMWTKVPFMVNPIKIQKEDILEHLKPALHLFIPQIASQVYVLLDKTMIGVLSTIEQVGFYSQAERLLKAILELITALGTVMLPRMSHIFARGEVEKMTIYLNKSLLAVTYISIPMAFGISAISFSFVPWFFGDGYKPVIYLMITLSPILVFVSMSSVMGVQYLLPSNKVNQFTFSIIMGAIVNLILNTLLIPKFEAIGAAIGTISAEGMVMFVQFVYLKNIINKQNYLINLSKILIASMLMFFTVYYVGSLLVSDFVTTLIQVVLGIIVYAVVLILVKEDMNTELMSILYTYTRRFTSEK